VSTYSSGYVSGLKTASGFVFRIKTSNEIATKRHDAEDLNPQHHRLMHSNHAVFVRLKMYCREYSQ
jgi:hypothetical protein